MRWRTGRKNKHTIYAQLDPEPTDADEFLGALIRPHYSEMAVEAVNMVEKLREELSELHQEVWGGMCSADGDDWPCRTMKIVEDE